MNCGAPHFGTAVTAVITAVPVPHLDAELRWNENHRSSEPPNRAGFPNRLDRDRFDPFDPNRATQPQPNPTRSDPAQPDPEGPAPDMDTTQALALVAAAVTGWAAAVIAIVHLVAGGQRNWRREAATIRGDKNNGR